jgi:hypothetical protein
MDSSPKTDFKWQSVCKLWQWLSSKQLFHLVRVNNRPLHMVLPEVNILLKILSPPLNVWKKNTVRVQNHLPFQVLVAASMKITVFWNVTMSDSSSWWCRQYILPKRWLIYTRLYGATPQTTFVLRKNHWWHRNLGSHHKEDKKKREVKLKIRCTLNVTIYSVHLLPRSGLL